MADPVSLITAGSLAKSVAELAGLIESTEGKIDRMVHAPLGAALLALRDAGVATDPDEQVKLLDQSAAKFRDAVQHEVGIRRVQAHLGLGVCYRAKGEYPLSLAALCDACAVRTPRERLESPEGFKERAARAAREVLLLPNPAFGLIVRLARRKRWSEPTVDEIMTPAEVRESDTMMAWRASILQQTAGLTALPPQEFALAAQP